VRYQRCIPQVTAWPGQLCVGNYPQCARGMHGNDFLSPGIAAIAPGQPAPAGRDRGADPGPPGTGCL